MREGDWPRFAVMGAGAVGCYFGAMLARAGAPVTLIGRAQHAEAIARAGLLFESGGVRQVVPVAASAQAAAAAGADVVLLCVKSPDTEAAARALAPHLGARALLLSLQNGVDNPERIRAVAGIEAIPAVVYVGAEMTAPGCVRHTALGELIVGALAREGQRPDARRGELEALAAQFARARVPCTVSDAIEAELWGKLIMNCAHNAISALARARYGPSTSNPHTRELMRLAVGEVVSVARASGVPLADRDWVQAVWQLGEAMPETRSSTAQDLARGRRTEIDALNGYVVRRGAALGLATPVNQTLHALVKLLEESRAEERDGEARAPAARG